MISPILPARDADTIALDFGVFVALQARTYRVSQSAIIAAINQQPSAPSRPKAAAASTPPVGAQAEEVVAPVSSATNNQKSGGKRAQDEIAACLSDEGAEHSLGGGRDIIAPVGADSLAGSDTAEAVAGKSVGASAPAAPARRITQRQRVRECHEAHPDWTAQQVADALGLTKTNVQSVASQIGIKWDGKKASTTEALKQAVKAAPSRASVAALPIAKSLKDRVRETLTAHPTWTAAQIANHIGHSVTSVSTTLANVRREAAAPAPDAPPQFSGRREMVEHYGAIAKRLGKPS